MPPGAARWHPTQRLPKEPASWMVVAALVCRGRRRRKSQASDGASFFQKHGQVVTENKQRRSHTLSFTGGLACLREAVCTWEFLMRNVHADSTHTCLHHGMLGLGSSRSVRCAQSRVADGMGQKREKRERERERCRCHRRRLAPDSVALRSCPRQIVRRSVNRIAHPDL